MRARSLALFTCCSLLLAACELIPVQPEPLTPPPEPEPKHSAAVSVPANAEPSTLAVDWFDAILLLIKDTPGFTPPVASRALGYAGVTLYESLVHGMPGYESLSGQLSDLPALPQTESGAAYSWPLVANAAMATIVPKLFPTAAVTARATAYAIETRYDQRYRVETDEETARRSAAYGRMIAEAIFEWSTGDGGHEGFARNFPADYAPPTGSGMWVQTPRKSGGKPLAAMQPTWGKNRTFVPESVDSCSPPPPPDYSETPDSDFYNEASEVYATVSNLTDEQRAIALFWADDPGKTFTPPGHSISIASQILRKNKAMLDTAAETYARVGVAIADAFIGCWKAKYEYNLLRPITYIQHVIDPTWNTPIVTDPVETPPFPEYPSGHSVQTAAAAEVLTQLFGDNVQFTDATHAGIGLPPRTFPSFTKAAEEAAASRLFGGIHYRSAIEKGFEQGTCIGKFASGLQMKE